MICVSISEEIDLNILISKMNNHMAEVRMDRMDLSLMDVSRIFSMPLPLIATYRPKGNDNEMRKRYLLTAIEAGAKYVDIEFESDDMYKREIISVAKSKHCQVIISFHDYENTPSEEALKEIVSICFKAGADIAKIACKVNSPIDNGKLLGLLCINDFYGRVVVAGMGKKGNITVLLPMLP